MEWPEWSMSTFQAPSDCHPFIDRGLAFSTLCGHAVTRLYPQALPEFPPFPPATRSGSPSLVAAKNRQGSLLAATTPRNTHPTLQSGRCSRDIACLIGGRGRLFQSCPPFCHAAPPPHMCAVPKAQVAHTITIVTPRSCIVFVGCIPLRRDQATISGTWDAPPPPKTHPSTYLL